MPDGLEIADLGLRDDGAHLVIDIVVRNPTSGRLYACATVRRVRYEPAARVLRVQLSDRAGPPAGSFVLPSFLAIEPGRDERFTVTVPRVIARLAPGKDATAPAIESLPAHEAATLEVEVAWSDAAFQLDASHGDGPRALAAWPRGYAVRDVRLTT
jgi:hypothetical protein